MAAAVTVLRQGNDPEPFWMAFAANRQSRRLPRKLDFAKNLRDRAPHARKIVEKAQIGRMVDILRAVPKEVA